MASKERLDWLDAARGVSIVLIVVFHATDWLAGFHQASSLYVQINLFFRPIRVPLFFLISGILAARYMSLSWKEFINRRVSLLLYIYGVWSFINWLYFSQFQDGIHNITFGRSAEQLATFWYDPIIGLWFIWCLAIYYVVTKLSMGFRSDVTGFIACFVSIAVFSYYFKNLSVPQMNLFWYFAFFYVGVKYGTFIAEYVSHKPLIVLLVGSASFVCIGILLSVLPIDYYKNGLVFGYLRFMLSVFGTAAGLAAAVLVCHFAPARLSLSYVGKRTIYIYVINEILVSLVSIPFSYPLTNWASTKYWSVPLVVTSVIALALGLQAVTRALGLRFLYELPTLATFRFTREVRRLSSRQIELRSIYPGRTRLAANHKEPHPEAESHRS